MEQALKDYMLAIAEEYARANGWVLATVARRLHGDDGFFRKFAAGEVSITLKKYDEMLVSFASDWPEDAEWPKPNGMLKTIRTYPRRRRTKSRERKAA